MEQIYIDGRCEFFSDFEDLIRYLKSLSKYEDLAKGIEKLVNQKVASIEEEYAEIDCYVEQIDDLDSGIDDLHNYMNWIDNKLSKLSEAIEEGVGAEKLLKSVKEIRQEIVQLFLSSFIAYISLLLISKQKGDLLSQDV